MNINDNLTNFEKAKIEADKIDSFIIDTLQSGKSFRVEAGAGSGKTYSLKKVIDWIQKNKTSDYNRKQQNVICITYTNVAVSVISSRLGEKSSIIPSTIHSFAWSAIKQFQSSINQMISNDSSMQPDNFNKDDIKSVQYTLGHRYFEDGILYLFHNDVIKLFCNFLDILKFRKIFSSKFPLILIDEYQDSFKSITDKFLEYFISKNVGPQFGFFGDSWQTIYQMNNPCGLIEHENIIVIQKPANFRSPEKIVTMLNKIRPNLPQISAIDEYEGSVFVINCNDFKGIRRTDRNFNGELPQDEFTDRLNKLKVLIENNFSEENDTLKTLMISHRVLANQQGYANIFQMIGDRFKDEEDDVIKFFMNIVEPIYNALDNSDMNLLFQTLGIKRYPITTKADKKRWADLKEKLSTRSEKFAIDVLKIIKDSMVVAMPPSIDKMYNMFYSNPNEQYVNTTVGDYLKLHYSEFISAINFLYPDAEFSTEHGVKGEEYDNVIFTIGRGWSNYQFDIYAPMLIDEIKTNNMTAFERNRNLFYVCCSRPKKRLFIFVTIETSGGFENFLQFLVGQENFYSYNNFIEKFKKK